MFARSITRSFTTFACSLIPLGCEASSPKPPDVPEPASTATSPLAQSARALGGRWACSGSIHGPDGPSPSQVRLEITPELGQAWLRTEFLVESGEYEYEFKSFRTYDDSSGRWLNVIIDNLGGHATSWSADGVTWTGDSRGPMGAMKIKDTETIVAAGVMNMLGQYSQDGASWKTGYDLACKR